MKQATRRSAAEEESNEAQNAATIFEQLVSADIWRPTLRARAPASTESSVNVAAALAAGLATTAAALDSREEPSSSRPRVLEPSSSEGEDEAPAATSADDDVFGDLSDLNEAADDDDLEEVARLGARPSRPRASQRSGWSGPVTR